MAQAILFSDLHSSTKRLYQLTKLVQKDHEIKLLIFAGDLVDMGEPVWFVSDFVEVIKTLGLPLVWVPGNNDFGRAYHKLQANFKSIEGKVFEAEGQKFTGVGGSPASWAGQYGGEAMVDKKAIAGTVFISHYPPPGVHNLMEREVASPTSLRKFADSPKVHICGHLHYRSGLAYLGQTKIVQLASLETGHYALMDLTDLTIEFKKLPDKIERPVFRE